LAGVVRYLFGLALFISQWLRCPPIAVTIVCLEHRIKPLGRNLQRIIPMLLAQLVRARPKLPIGHRNILVRTTPPSLTLET
jgi:hypothetical protein